jgi:hypothetical protein
MAIPATFLPEHARRLDHARAILDTHSSNDWDGDDAAETIAAARYAVVVERDSDAWVLAARTARDVAGIEYGTYFATEGYDEWIAGVMTRRPASP